MLLFPWHTRKRGGSLNMQGRPDLQYKRISRVSLLRLGGIVILSVLTLQVLTAAVLLVIAVLGKRRPHEVSFPHHLFDEVQVGENALQLFTYGRDLYDAMLEAIDTAHESIYLETYIWKADAVGLEFQEHLARKAEEGVAVNVIFDSFGNLVVPAAFKSSFHPAIHVLEYRGIRRPWHLLDLGRYALDHRKVLVTDGTTGFIGGYNLGSLYATEWRDTHLAVRGPGAAELARSFIGFWNRFCPAREQITQRYPHQFDALLSISQNETMRAAFPIRDLYIAAIDQAEHSILLTTAYFIPDQILVNALKDAVSRGVDVCVLVPWQSNHVLADWMAHSYVADCLKGGIRIFGYRHSMLHAKTCTIDGQWSTIGTCNLDRLSLVGNYEINLAVYSTALAQQMSALFAEDTADQFELTLEQWERRPWYHKVSERILAPLRFLL